MFRNYLKIAWRNLWKTKLLTAVNILGLSVAFAAAILLVMTAYREFSYDRFHANKELYMLYINTYHAQGLEQRANMPMPLTPAMKQEFPEVKAATRMLYTSGMLRYHDKIFQTDLEGVDVDFLHMFSFPVTKGNTQAPLASLDNIVLSAQKAKSIFGNEEPVGKQLEARIGDNWKTFIVSAVTNDVPDNSSVEFDALCRFENAGGYEGQKDAWSSSTHYVYVQLADHAGTAAFERRSKAFVNKYFAERLRDLKRDGATPGENGELIGMHLRKLTDLHLNGIGSSESLSKFYPYLLLLVGAFILFIACINFMNLTIAGAFTRSREIGMRKILGAFRFQLITQMWGEAVLVCGLALLIGLAAAYLLLPGYNSLFKSKLTFGLLQQPLLQGVAVLLFFLVTLIAGGYPAWVIARLNTIKVLKGSMQAGRSGKVRNVLMVTQFVISSLLICCTLIAWQQLNYLRNQPLGFNQEQVISLPLPHDVNPEQALKRMRNKLAGEANVLSVTGTDINLGRGRDGSSATSKVSYDYNGHVISSNWLRVDYDYVKTLDLTLVAGRDFSPQYGADSMSLVINEKMAQQLGGVKAALGALLPVSDSAHPMQVIGIVKDFNFHSLQEKIEPLSMFMSPGSSVQYIFVKVPRGNLPASMALVTKRWNEAYPGNQTDPSFLDENTERQYRKEKRFSSIFISAAVLAIVISCMGLFAISVLVMTQRTREIGVRKVLGASVTSIVTLLSKDFVKLVLLSVIIASPVAWYLMEQWLQNYAYRIHINIGIFIGAAVIAVLVAVITVSVQSIRAALMNPVKSIRTE